MHFEILQEKKEIHIFLSYIYPTKFQVTANFYSIKEFKETWTNGSIFKILELDNRNSFPRNGGSRKEKEEDGIDETFVKVREFF